MGSYPEFVFWSATVSAVFILTLPGTAVSANNALVTTACPSLLEDNKTAEIQCTVNSTGISNANCIIPPSTVTFELAWPTGLLITFCAADYPCDLSSSAGIPCGCISSDNGTYKYTFSFLAKKTVHDGKIVKCIVDCIRGNISYENTGPCNGLQFDSTSGSTPSSNGTVSAKNALVTTACPSLLEDNKTAEIQCTVNSTGISNANCIIPPAAVTFELSSPSGSVITFCVADYPCDLSSSAGKACGCISSDNGKYMYTFSFLANKTVHDGKVVKCIVDCFGGNVSYENNNHCNGLQFVSANNALVTTACPSLLEDSKTADIQCTVNSTGISNANCIIPPAAVTFELSSPSGLLISSCAADYPYDLSSSAGKPCGCISSDDGIHKYTFSFLANKSVHDGKIVKCIVDCIGGSVSYENTGPCNGLQFDSTSGSTPSSNGTVSANNVLVTTACPSFLEDNKTAEIQCTVNSTGISNANCIIPPSTVTFELTSPSGSVITFCAAVYPCDLSSSAAKACGCISSDNGIYKYTYSFLAKKTVHDGTTVKCIVVCIGGNVSYGDNGHCNGLQFGTSLK